MPSPPCLLVFLAWHALAGIAVGWAVLAALLLANVGRIGELLLASESALPTLLLAAAGFGGSFGGLAMATGIFLLPRR